MAEAQRQLLFDDYVEILGEYPYLEVGQAVGRLINKPGRSLPKVAEIIQEIRSPTLTEKQRIEGARTREARRRVELAEERARGQAILDAQTPEDKAKVQQMARDFRAMVKEGKSGFGDLAHIGTEVMRRAQAPHGSTLPEEYRPRPVDGREVDVGEGDRT